MHKNDGVIFKLRTRLSDRPRISVHGDRVHPLLTRKSADNTLSLHHTIKHQIKDITENIRNKGF